MARARSHRARRAMLSLLLLDAFLQTHALAPQKKTVPLAESRYTQTLAFDAAIPTAGALREVFEARFASPRESHAERYLWDPWHVSRRLEDMPSSRVVDGGGGGAGSEAAGTEAEAGTLDEAVAAARSADAGLAPARQRPQRTGGSGLQYSMLRTPASSYFPEDVFEAFCAELSGFGREFLGCDAFTPPWLALYTDGHEMGWHSDASHGPFAFVLSLTPDGYHGR